MCPRSISAAFPCTRTQTCRTISSPRFVPPWKQGRKKFRGKKKVPSPWTACVAIRRKDLLLFLCIPQPNVSGVNAAIYPDKRFSTGLDCFRYIVTALAWFGLPAFDGGAEALVGGRAAPVEMMFFGRPL